MFRREMDYSFHYIKHIMQTYLDDLLAHSKYQANHLCILVPLYYGVDTIIFD